MSQVGDYGCTLKMDAGADVLAAQARLLKVFLLVGGAKCSEYVRALTASLLQWSEYERVNHPCWQLFANNASAFNEESGEISLSVLAREIARGGVRSDCKKVSQTFKLVKAKSEVAADIGVDISGGDFGSDEHGRRIDPNGEEVKATAAYFSGVIRHVLAGALRHYDKDNGVLAKGVRAARPNVAMSAFPACFRSVAGLLDAGVAKLEAGTVSFWVAPHVDVWPAAVPTINFDSEEEEEAGAGGAAGGQAAGVAHPPKRKAAKDAAGADGAAKRAKKASGAELVGCVVAVPAWKFGAQWAAHHFQRPSKAVLIGDVTEWDGKRRIDPFSVAMRGDKGYILRLKQSEVEEFMLAGADAALAVDTPWKDGVEVD